MGRALIAATLTWACLTVAFEMGRHAGLQTGMARGYAEGALAVMRAQDHG